MGLRLEIFGEQKICFVIASLEERSNLRTQLWDCLPILGTRRRVERPPRNDRVFVVDSSDPYPNGFTVGGNKH